VTVAAVTARTVPVEIRAVGHVEPSERVEVRARVGGQLERVGFAEGDRVAAGQILFEVDPRPYQTALAEAEARLERDRALVEKAEQDVARYADLARDEYVSREQLDQARANAAALRATVNAEAAAVETARLELSYCTIAAPISGRTGDLLVHAGNLVKANDAPLVVIHRVEPCRVSFAVPEGELAVIRDRHRAGRLGVAAMVRDNGMTAVEGELSFVDNQVDEATGTIRLKAAFANRDGRLWPGQFVDVVLTLGEEEGALTVPSQAVQTGQGGLYLFVVRDDQTVESRPVTVGRVHDGDTVVTGGVAAGEVVVTDGQLRLVPGVRVTVKETGTGTRSGSDQD
jgi:multidrug efflux system membrane fusion protein